MTACPTCGTTSRRCLDRVPLRGGGWACRGAMVRGLLPGQAEQPRAERGPSWSAGAVLHCPACGNVCHSRATAGFPWRRCAGPDGCGYEWNPEAEIAA